MAAADLAQGQKIQLCLSVTLWCSVSPMVRRRKAGRNHTEPELLREL